MTEEEVSGEIYILFSHKYLLEKFFINMNSDQNLLNKQLNFFFDIKHIKRSKYLNFDKKYLELIKHKKNSENKFIKIVLKSLKKIIKEKDQYYYSEILN